MFIKKQYHTNSLHWGWHCVDEIYKAFWTPTEAFVFWRCLHKVRMEPKSVYGSLVSSIYIVIFENLLL